MLLFILDLLIFFIYKKNVILEETGCACVNKVRSGQWLYEVVPKVHHGPMVYGIIWGYDVLVTTYKNMTMQLVFLYDTLSLY